MFDARVHSFRFYKLFFREFRICWECRFELTVKYVRFWIWITKQFAIHHQKGNSYVVLTFVFYVCPEFFHSRVWFFLDCRVIFWVRCLSCLYFSFVFWSPVKLFCDPDSKSNILNRQFKSAFSANSKFMKKEFIKSKRMDPSIKHQTMKPFNITTNGIIKLLKEP
jgi:hypothetical protein